MKKLLFILLGTLILQFSQAQAPNDNIGSGNCLDFDRVNDYVDLGAPASLTAIGVGDLTVQAWINPNAVNSLEQTIFCSYGASYNEKLRFGLTGGRVLFNRYPRTIPVSVSTDPVTVQPGVWTHVAAVLRDADNEVDFYINGVKYTRTYNAEYTGGTPTQIAIGALRSNGNSYSLFGGEIDEISIWNRALSETEIRDNMCRQLEGNETGLVGYWNMNEGAGGTITDLTPNGNDGTLQ